MFSSLRARLWLSYALLIGTALAVVGIVLLIFLLRNPYIYRQAVLRLGVANGVLRGTSLSSVELTSVAQEFGVRALVFSPDGTLVEDSEPGAAAFRLPPAILSPRALATARDQTGRLWLYTLSRTSGGNWLLVATPRPALAPLVGIVSDELVRPILEGGLIALLLALVLAYALARWIADPLQRLIAATRQFATRVTPGAASEADRGNASGLVAEGGPQEVQELTRAFNAMVARVQASQRSQRELVANVSHELKTPLTSIQGFAQALMDGAADTEPARQHAAEVIHAEASRMHRMVVDLLDLAKLDAGTAELHISAVQIGALLETLVERVRPLAEQAGIGLTLRVTDQLPALSADADRLAQVFTNLLDNALKFTPKGGSISIQASMHAAEVQVGVADNGVGIAAEDLVHIFDRFYQADAARAGGDGHGSGLGLAIAREIVVAHGGRITVRSTPGRGTEFHVFLPVKGDVRQL